MADSITSSVPALSFTRKQIVITFDVVGSDGKIAKSLTLEGDRRIQVIVSHAGLASGASADVEIWGMSPHDMAPLSIVAGMPNVEAPQVVNQTNSYITIRAGEYGRPLMAVYQGNITESYAVWGGEEAVFHVSAFSLTPIAGSVTKPLSYRGPRSVLSILSDICEEASLILSDHGGWDKSSVLTNAYLEGSALDKIKSVMSHCRGTWHIASIFSPQVATGTGYTNQLDVWGPSYAGGYRADVPSMPKIAASTGMIGYPEYNRGGLRFSCLFRPDIAFYQPVYVDSKYSPVGWAVNDQGVNAAGQRVGQVWDGTWLPIYITHEISSEMPGGPWFTRVECQRAYLGHQETAITAR